MKAEERRFNNQSEVWNRAITIYISESPHNLQKGAVRKNIFYFEVEKTLL
jgi:hypothetical protein